MLDACPSCGEKNLEKLYEARGIPAHSCLLMESRAQATDYPKGDLVLALCRSCGFACNTAFDVSLNAYSPCYEEVQTFSPTFNQFASDLVDRLIDERGIHDKLALEIGCGKGEFLLELCDRGNNRGIGIDPSYKPGRGHWASADRVQFQNELYSAGRHGVHAADAIICRHTLEHVAPTGSFVRGIRDGIGERSDTLVFFEIPNQERVYRDRAFWDLYYEHCSYFTAGSLERLFLRAGFEILDSWKGFGDQYLLIEARPRRPEEPPRFQVEEDLEAMTTHARAFAQDVLVRIEAWRERFRRWHAEGKRVAIWGAGSKGVAFLTTIGLRDEIAYAIDVNPHKHGFYMPGTGHEVVAPKQLAGQPLDVVVLMNSMYRDEVRNDLASFGQSPELHAI